MKKIKLNHNELPGVHFLVPQALLDSLVDNQNKILSLLTAAHPKSWIGDYLPQEEVQKLLGRKATWLYNMRSKGLLSYSRVGSKIFYAKADIEKFLENNKQPA